MNNAKYLDRLLFLLYIIFFVSIVCCFRAVTSIVIPVILVAGIYKNKITCGSYLSPHLKNYFFLCCCMYYLIQLIVLLNSQPGSGKLILLKSAIIFVPAMVCCSQYPGASNYRKLMCYYVWLMGGAAFFCLATAFYKYIFHHAGPAVFYYHELVSPLRQHAIQFSILIFIALIYLLESAKKIMFIVNKKVHYLLIVFFTLCILLLSSKLVILFTAACFLYYFFIFFKAVNRMRVLSVAVLVAALAMIASVLFTQNQVSKRFNEIIETNMDLVSQKEYNPGTYFNGLQFRLLQWRFTKEILTERAAWLTGVADESQKLLDKKYMSLHMYTGDGKSKTDHGYLGYNTHNQFLESLLQTGLIGLFSYLLVFLSLALLAFRGKRRVLSFVALLLLAYSLNESILERQYSIILFTFFPLLFYYGGRVKVRSSGH